MIRREDIEFLNKEELIKLIRLLDKKFYYTMKHIKFDEDYKNTKKDSLREASDNYLDVKEIIDEEILKLIEKNKVNMKELRE